MTTPWKRRNASFRAGDEVRPCPKRLGRAGCIRRIVWGWENDLIRPRFARPPSPGEGASLAAGRTRRRWRLGRAGCIRRLGERPHPASLRSATFPRGKAHPLPQAVRDEGGRGARAASVGPRKAGRTTSSDLASLGHLPQGKAHPLPQAVRDEGGGWGAQAASAGRENGLIRPRFARPPSPGGEGACPAASIKNGPPRKTAKGRNHSLSDHRTGGPLRPLFSCARQSVTCPGSPGTSRTAPESPGGSPRPCPSEPALGPSPCRKS